MMSLWFLQWPLTLLYPALYVVYQRKLAQKRAELTAILKANPNTERLYQRVFGMPPELVFKKWFSWSSYLVPVVINAAIVWALSLGILIRTNLVSGVAPELSRFLH